jgi:xanthine dehydrogenase YagS FAD-binding subunit
MQAFEYTSATTKQQAVDQMSTSWGETELLAGGTDLLSLMKDDVAAPKKLINIKEIKELQGIKYSSGSGLRIGALVTIDELARNSQVRQNYAGIYEAAREIGSPQVRHVATVGGNLVQRPRCWYYRSGFGLLGQDASGKSLVPEGDNRYHAILGNGGPAYYVHPSSLAPVLIALGARVKVFGAGGEREVPLESFYVIPKSNSERETVLKPKEVITEVIVPAAAGARSSSYEVRQKDSFDWPLAMAAVALKLSGNTIQSARVVLGHVAPTPWRSQEAEAALAGKTISEETAQAAGTAAVQQARDLGRNGYKIQLAKVAVKRAIMQLARA